MCVPPRCMSVDKPRILTPRSLCTRQSPSCRPDFSTGLVDSRGVAILRDARHSDRLGTPPVKERNDRDAYAGTYNPLTVPRTPDTPPISSILMLWDGKNPFFAPRSRIVVLLLPLFLLLPTRPLARPSLPSRPHPCPCPLACRRACACTRLSTHRIILFPTDARTARSSVRVWRRQQPSTRAYWCCRCRRSRCRCSGCGCSWDICHLG